MNSEGDYSCLDLVIFTGAVFCIVEPFIENGNFVSFFRYFQVYTSLESLRQLVLAYLCHISIFKK